MGDYELQPLEQGNYEVVVSDISYSLTEVNKATLPLVQSEKQKLLMKINLQEMLNNLLNSTKLLDIVYCSVSSMGELQGEVSELQTNLLRDIGTSEIVMQGFLSQTEDILDKLSTVYPNLSDGEYDAAIRTLTKIKRYAVEMCSSAEELRDLFQTRCDETNGILTKTIHKNSELYEQRDKIREEIANMNAELDAAETLKEILNEQIESMNEEYRTLEKKEEQAASRAYKLELTGAILGGIGELISTVVPVKEIIGGIKGEEQTEKDATEPLEPECQMTDEAAQQNEKVQEKQKKIQNIDAKIAELNKEIEEIEKLLKSNLPEDEFERLREEGQQKKQQLEELEKEKMTEQKATDKIKDALKSVGNSFSNAADKQQSNVEAYNKRLQEIYRLRQEIKKQDAENKAKIAEYTSKVAASIMREDALDLSVKSLTMAIGCMRRIVVILNETVLFWKSIAKCCEKLSQSELIEDIEEGSKVENAEGKVPFYMQRLFVKTFLLYLIRWTALNLISGDYLEAMEQVRAELKNRIGRGEGEREAQWELAARMAKDLKI